MYGTHRLVTLVTVVIWLAGCATTAKGPDFAQARATAAVPDKAIVYVYRRHAEPTAWSVAIRFDDRELAKLDQGSFTWAALTPGRHRVSGIWSALSGQRDSAITIKVDAATIYYLEITGIARLGSGVTVTPGGGVLPGWTIGSGIRRVEGAAAEAAMAACCTFRPPRFSDY